MRSLRSIRCYSYRNARPWRDEGGIDQRTNDEMMESPSVVYSCRYCGELSVVSRFVRFVVKARTSEISGRPGEEMESKRSSGDGEEGSRKRNRMVTEKKDVLGTLFARPVRVIVRVLDAGTKTDVVTRRDDGFRQSERRRR